MIRRLGLAIQSLERRITREQSKREVIHGAHGMRQCDHGIAPQMIEQNMSGKCSFMTCPIHHTPSHQYLSKLSRSNLLSTANQPASPKPTPTARPPPANLPRPLRFSFRSENIFSKPLISSQGEFVFSKHTPPPFDALSVRCVGSAFWGCWGEEASE